MEKRLVALNAVISLTVTGDLNRAVLADAGYGVAALELPITTSEGIVVIDLVLANGRTGHLLACEAKSGANIDVAQAGKYALIDATSLAQSAYVTLQERPTVEAVLLCLSDHVDRIKVGLDTAGLTFPVVAVHHSELTLENPAHASDVLRKVFASPVQLDTPPQRWIPFDQASDIDVIKPFVKAELVAMLALRAPQVSFTTLAERAAPQFALFHQKAQGQLRKRVETAARLISAEDTTTFQFHPSTANHDGFVRFLRNPEDNDPRGRTQGYQALARGGQVRRRAREGGPEQLDLLAALDVESDSADSVDEASRTDQEDMG